MITRDEWLKALDEAGLKEDERAADAVTIDEFAAMMNIARYTAARQLDTLVAAGKATRLRKRANAKDGRVMRLLAYRLSPPTQKRQSKRTS